MLTTNEYFEGNVKSIGFQTATLAATVGVMAPGAYEFDTSQKEVVTVISGSLTVQLPNSEGWQTFTEGTSFTVRSGQTFQLRVEIDTAYLCTYE